MKQKYIMPECTVCELEAAMMVATSLNVDNEKGDDIIGDVNLNNGFTDIWGHEL